MNQFVRQRLPAKIRRGAFRLIVISLIAALGFTAIDAGRAATFTAPQEAEAGQVTGNAAITADTTASQGGAVLFGGSANDLHGLAAPSWTVFDHPTAEGMAPYMDAYKATGATWLRFELSWAFIQSQGPDSYDWSVYDVLIRSATQHGFRVLGLLMDTPAWARPSGCTASDKCAPADMATFATFAGKIAGHYRAMGVKDWEIWNEPNIPRFWQPAPNSTQYAQMLKLAYPAIKQAVPDATVITAGTAPAEENHAPDISPRAFLKGLYANGAKNYFDAVGHHPYCFAGSFDCPTAYADWSGWSQMAQTPENLRSIMTDNGDAGKKIWLTEFGAPTKGGAAAVSEAAQATMLTKAYDLARSYPWAGPLFWYTFEDPGNDPQDYESWFGLTAIDGRHKPSYDAYRASAPTP